MITELTNELKQHIEEQLGKPDYLECAPGHFAINVQAVANVASGDMYFEYTPGKFALNMNIVSNNPC